MDGTTTSAPVSVFLSYSHRDKTRKDKILEHLEPLQREKLATIWSDDRISLGSQWNEQIRSRIEQSRIAIVLVSTSFLNSPYCRTVEIAKFLQLRAERGLLIAPVILFACDWKNESWLAETQAFPDDDKTLFGNYSRPAALAKALQQLLERLRGAIQTLPAAPGRPEPTSSAPTQRKGTLDDAELIEHLFARDPLINSTAADALLARRFDTFDVLKDKFARVTPLNVQSVRRVCAAIPDQSGPVLMQCVMEADAHWHRANGAVDAFSHAHKDRFATALGNRLDEEDISFDIGRQCIEALGQMMASEWRGRILKCLQGERDALGGYLTSSYEFSKYHVYCVRALAKLVVGAQDAIDLYYLTEAIEFADAYSRQGEEYRDDAVLEVFATCSPVHADEIVRRWSGHRLPKLRRFCAYALANIRLSRVVSMLGNLLEDSDESVRTEAARALGNTGTEAAMEVLLRHECRGFALALGLEAVTSRDTCLDLTRESIAATATNEQWLAIRAAGLRGLVELRAEIEHLLHASDPIARGASALALARLDSASSTAKVRRAHEEAGDPRERVLTALAVVTLGDPLNPEVMHTFRQDLCTCASFMRPLREDVLNVLSNSGSTELARLAAAWKPVYEKHADY